MVPIWGAEAITVQPVRSGFPCFGAAIAGHVEGTRDGDDEKNRLCPPSPYPDTTTSWARMQAMGARSAAAFNSSADVKAWANQVAINPAAIPDGTLLTEALSEAQARMQQHGPAGVAAMAALAGLG
jgi:hypothetical protein